MASLKLARNHKHAINAVERLDEIGARGGIRAPVYGTVYPIGSIVLP